MIKAVRASLYICALLLNSAIAQAQSHEFYFPRAVTLLNDNYKGNYKRTAIKKDIVIVGPQVQIDHPIRSNGGNIVVIADTLKINAPLDSRIQFEMGPNYWVEGPDPDDYNGKAVSLWFEFKDFKQGQDAFDSQYMWQQMYDEGAKKYVYNVGKRPERARGAESQFASQYQLPSAQVPKASDHTPGKFSDMQAANGADAPSGNVINWSEVKSGNIYIYAHDIQLCDDCRKALANAPSKPSAGDPYDLEQAIFFNAEGLKGGRGSPGTFFPAPFASSVSPNHGAPFSSSTEDLKGKIGGLSGAPGKGGDAGDVFIKVIDQDADKYAKKDLLAAAGALGGRPAQVFRQRTPTPRAMEKNATRTVFANEKAISNPEALFGADGSVDVDFMSSDQSLYDINARLIQIEAGRNYIISSMLDEARQNESTVYFSPRDALTYLLGIELDHLQIQLLQNFERALDGNGEDLHMPDILSALSCESSTYHALNTEQQSYIERICQFRKASDLDGVRSFFYRNGGVFSGVEKNENLAIAHDEIVKNLIQLKSRLNVAIDEMLKDRQRYEDEIGTKTKLDMKIELQKLHVKQEEINRKRQNRVKSNAEFWNRLKDVAESVDAAVTAGLAENWQASGAALYKGYTSLEKLTQNPPPDAEEDLTTSIREEQEGLDALSRHIDEMRSKIIAEQQLNLGELVEARTAFNGKIFESRIKFIDLARSIVHAYLKSTANQKQLFTENSALALDGIRSGTRDFHSLTLAEPLNLCSTQQPAHLSEYKYKIGCAILRARRKEYSIISLYGRLRLWPLAVVSPLNGDTIVSFEYFFSNRDIHEKN